MKTIISNVLLVSLFIGLASCGNDEILADAKGDAFIITKIVDGETVHGLALHAFGNKPFTSVAAKDENDQSYQLSAYNGYSYDYYYETSDNAFTSELPAVGSYDFTINFQSDEIVTSTDELTDDIIAPAVITKSEYNETDSKLDLAWEAMDDADFIVIRLVDENKNPVFISEALKGTTVTSAIKTTTYGWLQNKAPVAGKTYTVELEAYMFEAQMAELNIQAESIATSTAVWGN